jgi:farnesol dehydrogenase
MKGTTLVTGATGLIGRHLVTQLRRQGAAIRILARNPEQLDPEPWAGVEVCRGDLCSPLRIAVAMSGVDTVIHLAALTRAWSRDPDEFIAVNVAGVRDLLAAAVATGVRRVVHVSTIMTHPSITGRRAPSRRLTDYEATKLAGDRLVETAADRGLDTVMVHPTRVYGPGPLGPSNGVTRLIGLALRSPVVARLADRDALGNYVHAADVATGIRLAAERGSAGSRYILGGENLSIRALLAMVGELSGRQPLVVPIPVSLATAAARVAVTVGHLGLPVPATPDWVRVFLEDQSVDITPTRRDLGYAPRSAAVGIEETIRWLQCQSPLGLPFSEVLRA